MKGEIVFPNNLKLGRLMDPPVAESTISKMESGERRLTNLQLADLATILDCNAEEIPVVSRRDPSPGVRRWQKAQQDAARYSVESGAAATGYVLAQLRKKSGKTMQQVAGAIGMTLSVYHRVEMASRIIHTDEIEAVAKFCGLGTAKLISLFERRTRDNLQQLNKGVAPEQLLPRTPRALLPEDAKWRRLGALERYASRRSIRCAAAPAEPPGLPVHGQMIADKNGVRRFVIDRGVTVDHVPVDELLTADDGTFFVRNFSQRLGFLMKPGSLACVEPRTPVAMGDIAFLVRHDGTAEATVVIGEGLGPLKLKMYNPEEEVPIHDQSIAAILRIRMLILP